MPLNQAESMHKSLKDKGVVTALVVFPGEGHGLRAPPPGGGGGGPHAWRAAAPRAFRGVTAGRGGACPLSTG